MVRNEARIDWHSARHARLFSRMKSARVNSVPSTPLYGCVVMEVRSGTGTADALIPHPIRPQEMPTDESTSKRQKCFVDISALFVA